MAPGEAGFCGVRRNAGGEVANVTYGSLAACNLSPIEIKPFFHFWPGTRHLSLGSTGCNFRCAGCQNWEMACVDDPLPVCRGHDTGARPSRDGSRAFAAPKRLRPRRREPLAEEGPRPSKPVPCPLNTTVDLPPERAVGLAKDAGADGISFTYNEPTVWLEYVLECARAAKGAGLLTNLVTNGYMTGEALGELARSVDAVRIDVKGTQRSYDAITSGVKAGLVRRNAERARGLGMHLEIVTNLIPGISDGEDILRDVARWIASDLGPETPWHVTRFHPARRLPDVPPTSLDALERGREIAREEGILFAYLGNVPGHRAESTWCPGCGELLVRRTGWGVAEVRLDGSRCPSCSRGIPITGEVRVTEGGHVGPVRVM